MARERARMPCPEQDSSLRALIAGEHPEEIFFDPITDNDSTGSCLGCAYSVLGGAAVLVGLYACSHKGVLLAERFSEWAGGGGLTVLFFVVTLVVFTAIECIAPKEVFVLVTESARLELRLRRGDAMKVLKSWEAGDVQRFTLDPPEEDPNANSGLYVTIAGVGQTRLLEPCYPREFVEQVERQVSAICQVPSTTS